MSAHQILRVRHQLCLQLKQLASWLFAVPELKHRLHLTRQFVRQLRNIKHRIAPLRSQLRH